MPGTGMNNSIHLEIVYEGDQCPASYYMAQAVLDVIGDYGDLVVVTKLEFKKNKQHAKRFEELSISLYGEEAYRKMRLAPIPSIFVDGRLVFDVIPMRDDLVETLERLLSERENAPE